MNSKTLRRDICVKVCGREAMMQEKSKEQGNGQKRGYNLLDKEEQKSHLLPRLIQLISNELYQSMVTVALIIQNQLAVSQLP